MNSVPKNDITLKNLNNICRILMTLTKFSGDFFLKQINENHEICTLKLNQNYTEILRDNLQILNDPNTTNTYIFNTR